MDVISEPFRDLKRMLLRQKSLPPYTKQDVEDFIAFNPVYGPQLKKMNQATVYCYAGAGLGGAGTAAMSLALRKQPRITAMAAVGGAFVGMALGAEVANFTLELYKFKKTKPKEKFLDWWASQN